MMGRTWTEHNDRAHVEQMYKTRLAVAPFCFALRWTVVVMRRVEKEHCFFVFLAARECRAIGLRVFRASIECEKS
jgi:hypothetical protein